MFFWIKIYLHLCIPYLDLCKEHIYICIYPNMYTSTFVYIYIGVYQNYSFQVQSLNDKNLTMDKQWHCNLFSLNGVYIQGATRKSIYSRSNINISFSLGEKKFDVITKSIKNLKGLLFLQSFFRVAETNQRVSITILLWSCFSGTGNINEQLDNKM